MEGVVTNREGTDVVVLLELEQAHGALVRAALARVDGERNGLDDGLVEAVRGEDVKGGVGQGGRVEVGGLQVAGGGGGDVGPEEAAAAAPAPVAAAEVDKVAGDEAGVGDDDEGGGDYDDHGDQRRAEVDGEPGRWWGS